LASAPRVGTEAFCFELRMTEAETDKARQGGDALGQARVLVVGIGALGCPAVWHLAAAGIGTLVLVDPDRIEISNLHRQLLHRSRDVGAYKVDSAAAALRRCFPAVRVETHAYALSAAHAPALFGDVDFVIDATDGVAAKFLLNDCAVHCGRPLSHAGILGFLGQTLTVLPGRTACYRCLFPEPPPPGEVPSCQEAGVVGGIAGVIGAVQAAEAIKYLAGGGTLATDCLVTYDALTERWRRVRVARNPRCPTCAQAPAGVGASAPASLDASHRARYGE
jgi:molybdopterin-synthase adenylyltransferase